jgi:hypothetical protein
MWHFQIFFIQGYNIVTSVIDSNFGGSTLCCMLRVDEETLFNHGWSIV